MIVNVRKGGTRKKGEKKNRIAGITFRCYFVVFVTLVANAQNGYVSKMQNDRNKGQLEIQTRIGINGLYCDGATIICCD